MADIASTYTKLKQFAPFASENPEYAAIIQNSPNADAAINQILGSNTFAQEALGTASKRFEPSQQLEIAGIDQSQLETRQGTQDLIKSIAENQAKQNTGMLERQNQLGLLQSGLTAAGLGDIAKTSTESTVRANTDLANTLARLALQRSGVKEKYAGQTQDLASQLRNSATKGYSEDYSARLQAALQEQQNQMELEKARLALQTSRNNAASSSYNPFAGINLGTTPVATPTAPAVPSIGAMPIDQIKNNVKGTDIIATFNKNGQAVTEAVSREALADILSGNGYNNTAARNTAAWNNIYSQILQAVPDIKADPTKISSLIQIPGQKTKPRGF
jgi:hypothetical protein